MIKNILFDFDGTLADTAPGIVNTMTVTLQRMKVPVPTVDAMRQTIGIPLKKALQMLGNFSDKNAEKATDIYSDLFLSHEVSKTTMFPLVCDTLTSLAKKGFRMAICTSRNVESLEIILKKYDLRQYFEQMVTHSDNLTPKPAPDMVLTLLDRMEISAEETLVVGDTTFDIQMGNAAGCQTCAVTYGNHNHEKLLTSNPTFVIDRFEDLESIVDTK